MALDNFSLRYKTFKAKLSNDKLLWLQIIHNKLNNRKKIGEKQRRQRKNSPIKKQKLYKKKYKNNKFLRHVLYWKFLFKINNISNSMINHDNLTLINYHNMKASLRSFFAKDNRLDGKNASITRWILIRTWQLIMRISRY